MEHEGVGGIGIITTIDLPGTMTRTGGLDFSMVRICTGEVCVRRSRLDAEICPAEFRRVSRKVDINVSSHLGQDEFGNVQCFKIVIGRFDFRTLSYGETDGEEDIFDILKNWRIRW